MAKYKLELTLPKQIGLDTLPDDKKELFETSMIFLKVLLKNNQDIVDVVDESPYSMILETTKDMDELLTSFPKDKVTITKL